MAVVDGITYSAENNRITVEFVDGDSKGNSFDDPYTFQDIYDTDVANGWGVFQKLNDFYLSDVSIYIQGIDTYFDPGQFMLKFTDAVSGKALRIKNNANFNSTNFSMIDSDSLIRVRFHSPNITLENCTLITHYYISCRYGSYNNLTISARVTLYGVTKFNNIKFINTWYPLNIIGQPDEMTNITAYNCNQVINVYNSGTIRNLKIYNSSTHFRFNQHRNPTVNVIDSLCDIDLYSITTSGDGHSTLNFKSTFKVNISGGDSGTATLYDKDDNQVAQQTLSGEWALTDPVLYAQRYVETSGGEITVNTKTVYEPFKLVVTKTGYRTLTIPNITVTAGEKTNVYGKMEEIEVTGENLNHVITEDSLVHTIVEDKLTHVITE